MTAELTSQIVALIALFVAATAVGVWPVVKLIRVYEAKHELKHGSAGFLRSLSGWAIIALWLMAAWFFATIIGDWFVSGDLGRAVERSLVRLRILMEIAIALMESD